MDPIVIPITIAIGAVFLAGLTLYRLVRMNSSNNTSSTVTADQIMRQARQLGATYKATANIPANNPVILNTQNNTMSPSPTPAPKTITKTPNPVDNPDMYY